MNNKFIKRVAAVVLGVAVLSTCAFATTLSGAGYEEATLSFSYASEADKVSYIAYAATENEAGTETINGVKYTLGAIVAIGQVDNNTAGTHEEEVKISDTLLGDATHIVIKSGDSAGADVAKDVVLAVEEFTYAASTAVEMKTVTLGEGEDAVTYENVPSADISLTKNLPAAGAFTISNLKITIGGEERDKAVSYTSPNVSGTGTVQVVNVYILGAPAGDVSIVPTVNFVPAQ